MMGWIIVNHKRNRIFLLLLQKFAIVTSLVTLLSTELDQLLVIWSILTMTRMIKFQFHNEFALDEGFYSFHKDSSHLMPLSYSDLERLEDIHKDDLLNRLTGNVPSRSRDDSDLIRRVKHEELTRQQRPKSERRRNNIRTMYHNVETTSLETGKCRPLPRSGTQGDDAGYHPEHGSVFKYLHELYSASIWVKCKEIWGQDIVKTSVQ